MIVLRLNRTAALCLALVCMVLLSPTLAATNRIYTSGAADGYTCIYWVNGYLDTYAAPSNQEKIWVEDFYFYWEGNEEFRSMVGVVQMPISSLQANSVQSASLWFYALDSMSVNLKSLSFDAGGTISPDVAYSGTSLGIMSLAPGWHSVDVTQALRTQINAGHNWAGFAFHPTQQGFAKAIAASEDRLGRGAYLEITPTPEPSSLMALLAGVTGLGGMIIRRKR